jgi:hypothetical protein
LSFGPPHQQSSIEPKIFTKNQPKKVGLAQFKASEEGGGKLAALSLL